MKALLPYLPYLLTFLLPLLCNGLHTLALLVKLPKAAAWIEVNTPTIDRLLLRVLTPGPKTLPPAASLALAEIGTVAKDHATVARADAMLRAALRGLGFVVAGAALALFAVGCKQVSGADVLRSSVDVRNQIAGVEVLAARELHTRCTVPMEAIAALPAGDDRTAKEKALAKTCDPLVEAYDGERRSRLAFDEGITSFASGKLTVGDLLSMLSLLLQDARALETEIAQ